MNLSSRRVLKLRKQIFLMRDLCFEILMLAEDILFREHLVSIDSVKQLEKSINQLDNDIDQSCLNLFFKEQLYGWDLRVIFMALKMNTDFERIGDLIYNNIKSILILQKKERLVLLKQSVLFDDFTNLFFKIKDIINLTSTFIEKENRSMCQKILDTDLEIDQLHQRMIEAIVKSLKESTIQSNIAVSFLMLSKNFERIGDHCTNLAQEMLFILEGTSLKHGKDSL